MRSPRRTIEAKPDSCVDMKSNRSRLFWILGVVSFALRVGAGLAKGTLSHPEVFEYDSAARAIVAGQGFVYGHIGVPYYSYMGPFSSYVGAASYWLTGSIVPLMLLQCLAGSLLVVATAAIVTRFSDSWLAAAVAGTLVAVHPGLLVYSAVKAHALAFDALFFALTLLQMMRLAEQTTTARALQLGVIVGIGALSRGTIVIFLPLTCLWLFVTATTELRWSRVRSGILAGLVAAAIIAPWTIRSSLTHHTFVFILTTDAEDFWRGNNPYASGHSYVDANHFVLTSIPPSELADLQSQPDEMAQARWFSTRARAFIREHPDQFIRLTLKKFFYFWWFAPQSGVEYPRLWLRLYQAYYVGVLCLAAIGFWQSVRMNRAIGNPVWLLLAFVLGLSGLQSFYYVEGRHRWAVEPAVIVLSGVGAAVLASRFAIGRSPATPVSADLRRQHS
jgi:4-amino-4-deoxy-L-arabinose transferase-like glycosyltransferase